MKKILRLERKDNDVKVTNYFSGIVKLPFFLLDKFLTRLSFIVHCFF